MRNLLTIFFSVVWLLLIGNPIRSNVGATHISYGTQEAPQNYTASDYIQDGLICMFDGIENTDYLSHDNYATAWKDLIGNHSMVFAVLPSWVENALILDGDANHAPHFSATDIMNAVNNNLLTVEVCACTFGGTAYGNNALFGLGRVDYRSFWFWSNARVTARGTQTNLPSIIEDGVIAWYSVGTTGVFKDGDFVSYITFGTQKADINDFYVGRIPGFYTTVGEYTAILGKVFSIRVYNRVLSAEEIQFNFMIDRERFGL